MILESLRKLALREGLVDDPTFESKPVRWIIELWPDGRFLRLYDTNLRELLPEGSKKKPRLEAKLMSIPRRVVRSVGIRANFLVDNAKYVLGIGSDPDAPSDPKNIDRHAAFLALLKAAPQNSPELQAVLAFLASGDERATCIADLALQGGFADNDLFTFEVGGFFLHHTESLRAYWASQGNDGPAGGFPVQCLVCGELRTPAKLHNQIQIRGASTSGVPLVSFNAAAFEKYGWSSNQNAPVCTACMTAYVEALRRLTRARYSNPKGEILKPLSTVLNGDTTAIYWADNDDPLASNLNGLWNDPKSVKDLLCSPKKGSEKRLRDSSRFFCLILTGVQGRAIVRRLHTGTVAEVERHLHLYFNAIHIARFHDQAPIPQFLLLKSIALNGELEKLPSELATELWLSALFGLPLSRRFLSLIVTRNRVEREDLRKGKWKVGRERAALTQFYFTSHGREATEDVVLHAEKDEKEPLQMGLNESSTDRAYLLGRVLATAERMQVLAQPQGLNRTLVDRFFSMASVRPKVVFAELMRLYLYHRSKAMRDILPLAKSTDVLWGKLLFCLKVDTKQPEQDAFGKALTLEEQGRFGLGYYHQKQDFINKAVEAREERARLSKDDAVADMDDPTLIPEETTA